MPLSAFEPDFWIDADVVMHDAQRGGFVALSEEEVVEACQLRPEERPYRFSRALLGRANSVKIIVFGSGMDVIPSSVSIDFSHSDTGLATFRIRPTRPGTAWLRVEFVANGDAIHSLDRDLMVEGHA